MKNLKNINDNKIQIVETIRGFAALAVCLFHISKSNMNFPGSAQLFANLVSLGWVGVEAFFVLSGFIIPVALLKANYQLQFFGKFLLRRCLRIEPPYLISIVLMLLLGYLSTLAPGFKGDAFNFNLPQVFSHIAYLPEHLGYEWLSPVYWSLEAEFHYYILIGLILPLLWKKKIYLFAGFLVLLGSSFVIPLTVFKFMPYFIPGIAACAFVVKKINLYEFLTVLIITLTVAKFLGHPWVMPVVALITALIIAFIEYGNKLTSFLGKISFSLYLLHVPIGGRVINYCGRYVNTPLLAWSAIILAITISIFAAWIFFKLIEKPSQMLSRKISYQN